MVLPLFACKVPGGQGAQAGLDGEAALYPGAHTVHREARASEKVPDGQASHSDARLPAACLPAGHSEHGCRPCWLP
jgi:hypothetical protein